MSHQKTTPSSRGIFGKVVNLLVTLSLVLVGSVTLVIGGVASPASADPTVCATGAGTGAFGNPNFMYEVRWGGNATAPFKGTAGFDKDSHGGLTQIVWNGVNQNSISGVAIDAKNWYPRMNAALNNTHMEYWFQDGTVWTAVATATVDGCLTNVDWNETHPAAVTTAVCTTTVHSPDITNQNARGWTFSETKATGHNEITADGLHVWTESNGSTDKAAGYKNVNIPLTDVGVPALNLGDTTGTLPSLQLVTDFNNDGSVDGILVGESIYGNDYWVPNSARAWVKLAAPSDIGGFGSTSHGTLDQWLVQFPNARVLQIGYSLGSGVFADATIETIDVGCESYGFAVDNSYATPTTVNVNDSEIVPNEHAIGWHDDYGTSPRSYSTDSQGLNVGKDKPSQIMYTPAVPLSTTDLESLITSAGVVVVDGTNVNFQVSLTYGDNATFTTIRSGLLMPDADSHRFSVTDNWTSSRALVDNVNGPISGTHVTMVLADLLPFISSQGNVEIVKFGTQNDSPGVIQDLVFNGTQYHFVPTGTTPHTQQVEVPESSIAKVEAGNYTKWHEGYVNATKSFSVDLDGLKLGSPAHSQILKGLDTPVTGSDLYALLTSQAGVTVEDGTVTYQMAYTYDSGAGWGTLRSAGLPAGSHTFSLTDAWESSKAIGTAILANTAYPLGDILDALNAEQGALATAFGVEAGQAAQVSSITWGDTEYTFVPSVFTGFPEIIGSPNVGVVLTVDLHKSGWTPATGLGFNYVWKSDGTPISGATGATFTVTDDQIGKKITVTVTGTKTDYLPGTTTTDAIGPVPTPSIVAGVPTISGTATVGKTLTVNVKASGWVPTSGVVFTYQWKAGGVSIAGATSSTYALTAAEFTKTITVEVTGMRSKYTSASTTTAATAKVAAGVLTKAFPDITGTAKVGQVLTTDTHSAGWGPALVTFTYQWKANGATIDGATSSTYTLTAADLGKTMVVTVTGSATGYASDSATSGGTPSVINDHIVVTRIEGADRYATAAKVAQKWSSAAVVYLATGYGFADALSAGPVAAFKDAPLLLTGSSALEPAAKAELLRLHPAKIVIVGGPGAVSVSVEAELKKLAFHPTVERIGGTDRYDTSRQLVAKTFPAGTVDTAYLATGVDFPDALTASPAAAHFGGPVVLVPGTANMVDAATVSLLNKLGVATVKIAGGTGVMSTGIANQMKAKYGIGNVDRNSGAGRYETAVAINADEFSSAPVVYLATGNGYADALAGAALAGLQGAPLFISETTCIPQPVMNAINTLGATSLVLLGGTGALSAGVEAMTICK